MAAHLSTTVNRVMRMEPRIRELVNDRSSHDQTLERWQEIMRLDDWKRLPNWARTRLSTVLNEAVHNAHRYGALRWALWQDPETGVTCHGWDDLPEPIRERYRADDGIAGFHYWVKTGVRF